MARHKGRPIEFDEIATTGSPLVDIMYRRFGGAQGDRPHKRSKLNAADKEANIFMLEGAAQLAATKIILQESPVIDDQATTKTTTTSFTVT